jgi:uncharacterized protein YqgV (UPF0045/DUF77 family)
MRLGIKTKEKKLSKLVQKVVNFIRECGVERADDTGNPVVGAEIRETKYSLLELLNKAGKAISEEERKSIVEKNVGILRE